MARSRDEGKRQAILSASKRLFALQGFHNTSISDIKTETGLPVGTIYTYFDGKDDIMSCIIEEGWSDLHDRLVREFSKAEGLDAKMSVIIDRFFPELLDDMDLINILLTEAFELTRIAEKLDALMIMVNELQRSFLPRSQPEAASAALRTAVVVYFLGTLNAARLSRSGRLGIELSDIQDFMRSLIYQNLRHPLE